MKDQLAVWCERLQAQLRRSVPDGSVDLVGENLEVVVWNEAAAAAAWRAADDLGIDSGLVRVIRPIPFLLPYPNDDDRNEEAWNEFRERRVRITDGDKKILLTGLDPEADVDARILVLGSMPGAESLKSGEYYANPRNRFWWIVEALLGVPRSLPYRDRVQRLRSEGFALWDVLSQCSRVGSLDRDIAASTEVPNDLGTFLDDHPAIRRVVLNGRKAEAAFQAYRREHVVGDDRLEVIGVPSTSPANAAVSNTDLLERWRGALTKGGG